MLSNTPEDQINARLELLARPEGVNFSEWSYSCGSRVAAKNVRLIAERIEGNPATKVFLCSYEDSKLTCRTFDSQQQVEAIYITNDSCTYSSSDFTNIQKRLFCIADLRNALEHTNVVEDGSLHITCNVTNLNDIEVVQTFFL